MPFRPGLSESDSPGAARLGRVFAARGAPRLVGDAGFTLDIREDCQIAAAWRQMWTRPDARGLVAGGALRSAAFSFDIAKAHLLQSGDRAALRFAQPLRVARGGIDLTLPVAHDYASGHTDFARSEEHTSELQSLMRISYAVSCL